MAYYRNKLTGRVQFHPKSGLGELFNADEIGEDGHPVKPRTSLAPSADELRDAHELMKDHSASPSGAATKNTLEAATERAKSLAGSKTTGKKAGDKKKQEGNQ